MLNCLQDKIADSLVGEENFLLSSAFGHYFYKKVQLPLHQRKRKDWKAKMAQMDAQAAQLAAAATAGASTKHKHEQVTDEIDDIFAAASKRR